MWHACTDVLKKRTHRWPEFKENINISSNDSFLFYHAGFLSFISSYGRRIISFHRDIQRNAVSGQFRQLRNNDIHSISPVSLPRFAGSHPKHQTEFRVSTPVSMGARIVALPPASYLGKRSAELKAESVWNRGYIGASYQGRFMHEECFWSTWPGTRSDDKLVLSPSTHLLANKTPAQ